jgi:hypothetical protein
MNKKRSQEVLFLWLLVGAAFAGGTFLICEHLGTGTAAGAGAGPMVAAQEPGADAQPDADVSPDDFASGTATAAVPMQTLSNDGYALRVPASWNIERTATGTIAVHPDAASPVAACKIEISAFPFTAGTYVADWIGHRIGADPSLSVAERSSEDVSVKGGTGVKWIGTIDDVPTTLVYLFSGSTAYEIAPSVIGGDANGNARCGDMLGTLLSGITM